MNDYIDNEAKMPQGLVGGAQANSAEHPSMPIFREYCKVKSEFDNTCRLLAETQQRKVTNEKRLCELSAKIQAMVEEGQYDPTAARAGTATPDVLQKAYNGANNRY